MSLNKKGVAFVIVAIVIVSVIAVVFFAQSRYTKRDKQEAVETRINTMDDFLNDFYLDVQRASYISGYRTFIVMEQYLAEPEHGFFTDPEKVFIEVFMNGTINGTAMPIMENATFSEYQIRVNKISKQIDIQFNASVASARMYHHDPWSVDVAITFNIYLNDSRGLASWNLTKTVTTNIPIKDLKDPLYTRNTGLPVTIRSFAYTEFVNASNNDTAVFLDYINNTYFINSTRAPSFVMRFSNNLSASPYGIESIVSIPDIAKKDVSKVFANRSVVDFIYFNGNENTAHFCNFTNVPGWVKLDNNSVLTYPYAELGSKLNYSNC